MKIKINNLKLDKFLDELSEEYKELLFNKLLEESNSYDEISISDLIRIDTKFKEQLLIDKSKQNRRKKAMMILGILYFFLGIVIYFYFSYEFSLVSIQDLLPLTGIVVSLMGVVAVIIAIVGPLYQNENKTKIKNNRIIDESKSKLLEYEIVSTWRSVEGIANDLATNLGIHDIMPNQTIKILKNEKYISEKEEGVLKSLFKLRNSLVHYGFNNDRNIIDENAMKILNDSVLIVDKLSTIL